MRLGLSLGYVASAEELHQTVRLAVLADRLGYDCAWVAEAYGSDGVTVMSAIAARTERIGIGSGVMQIPGRTPAMTAMTAATLDALSNGRFRLGLGVSGPQVSEGWHGVRYADPIGRTHEYVDIVRQALSRRRVTADGRHFTLPLPDGPGKPLVLAFHPLRPDIPVYLAAIGPKNLELTGQIADGWLGIFVDPVGGAEQIASIRRAAADAGRDPATLDIGASVPVSLDPNPQVAANRVRAHSALYIGGMGSTKTNFYHRIATSMGFGKQADEVQARFLARDYAAAASAVPFEFLDATCLLGDADRIGRRLLAYADGGIDSVNIALPAPSPGQPPVDPADTLRTVIQAAERAGVLE